MDLSIKILIGIVLFLTLCLFMRKDHEHFTQTDYIMKEISGAIKDNIDYDTFKDRIDRNENIKVPIERVTPEFFIKSVSKYATGMLTDTWVDESLYLR